MKTKDSKDKSDTKVKQENNYDVHVYQGTTYGGGYGYNPGYNPGY